MDFALFARLERTSKLEISSNFQVHLSTRGPAKVLCLTVLQVINQISFVPSSSQRKCIDSLMLDLTGNFLPAAQDLVIVRW